MPLGGVPPGSLGTSVAWRQGHRELGPRTLRRGHCPASGASERNPASGTQSSEEDCHPAGTALWTTSKAQQYAFMRGRCLQDVPWTLGLVRLGSNQDVMS